MDFGISRSYAADVTSTGAIIGTPAYMAPEQAEGRPVDHRTDIYALGLILYEMVTGTPAFTGDTAVTLAIKQVRERPKPPRAIEPSLPKHIEAAILRSLEKAPAARFQSVEEVIQALEGAPVKAPRRMRIPRLLLAAAGILLAAAGIWWWQGRESDSVRLRMETFSLANGLHVVLSPDHASPTFTLAVAYRSGYRNERPGQEGVAHLTEHALFQGSSNVAAGEHVTVVSDAGGRINAYTGADTGVYDDNLPANQLELALFLEADRMRGIELTPPGLATARGVLIQELSSHTSNPGTKHQQLLQELSFDNFSNQRNDWATAEHVGHLTIEDVVNYHRAHFTTQNAALALVGEFDPAKARHGIEKYFGSIPARPAPPAADVREPGRTAEKRETVADAALQTPMVFVSWRMPARNDADWLASKRLADVLGADDASRLHTSLVKNAAVSTGVSVSLDETAGPNLLIVSASVAAAKEPAQVEQLVYAEIERIAREGVPAEELNRIATDARRRRAFDMVQTSSRALMMAEWLATYGSVDGINEWERLDSRISSEDVRRIAQKYFAAANRTVVVVLPAQGGRR
jgi:zinc protease